MVIIKRIFILVTLFAVIGIVAYQFGKQNIASSKTNSKPTQQEEGLLTCPYKIKGSVYTKDITLVGEAIISEKPVIIENPEIIKMSEPFNLAEFEKDLYKLSTDKGWDERKFDVDNDKKSERIISANVAMNHTPHIALILKNGHIVFRADGPNIWIEEDPGGQGFTLHKTIDWNTGESEAIRYISKDGGFIPIWKQKSCWVHFE